MKRLQHVKRRLKAWNKNTFGGIIEKKAQIWNEISITDSRNEEEGGLSVELSDKKKSLAMERNNIIKCEEKH